MSMNFFNSLITEASNMMFNLQQRSTSHSSSFFQPPSYQLNPQDIPKKTEHFSDSGSKNSEKDESLENKAFNSQLNQVANGKSKHNKKDVTASSDQTNQLLLTQMIIQQQQAMISQLLMNTSNNSNTNSNNNLISQTPQVLPQQQLQLQLPQQLQLPSQHQQQQLSVPQQIQLPAQSLQYPQQMQQLPQQMNTIPHQLPFQQQLQMPQQTLQFPQQFQQQQQTHLQPQQQIFQQQPQQQIQQQQQYPQQQLPLALPIQQQPQIPQHVFQGTLPIPFQAPNQFPVFTPPVNNPNVLSQQVALQQVPAVIIPEKKRHHNHPLSRENIPQEDDSDDENDQFKSQLKKAIRKRQKKMNSCGHQDREHYAKGMCSNCYHRYGRTKKPWLCSHEKLYACGLCQNCYINKYNQRKRTETDGLPEEKTESGDLDMQPVDGELDEKPTKQPKTPKTECEPDQAADGDDEGEDEEGL